MTSNPWSEWIPGVLSRKQVLQLCENGNLLDVQEPAKTLDHSSIDLLLTEEAYSLTQGSVKPFAGQRYINFLKKEGLCKSLEPDASGVFNLVAKQTYLFKLRESLAGLGDSGIYGQATAKSSIGRMDVLARLIVDQMDSYDGFAPKKITDGSGALFIEVTPITFNVKVKPGIPLTQLRFFYGRPEQCRVESDEIFRTILPGAESSGGTLSVDLSVTEIHGHPLVSLRANEMQKDEDPLPLWVEASGSAPDPSKYWRFEKADKNHRLRITKGSFYILRSKERIAVPSGIAVYCRAIDEIFGEMRIHYAGFVHPFFGLHRKDETRGTPLIFEVRGHDIDANLADGEKMARLILYRMSSDAEDDGVPVVYNEQILKLSQYFGEWPDEFSVDKNGSVASK